MAVVGTIICTLFLMAVWNKEIQNRLVLMRAKNQSIPRK